MADDTEFARWLLALLERHEADIRWRALPEPHQEGGRTLTHEGILDLPGYGRVHAYLVNGEACFNCDDLDRVLGLEDAAEDDDTPCPFCGEDGCARACAGAILADDEAVEGEA